MFTSLRWRLTIRFVVLTTLVYTLSTICAIGLFHAGLTQLIKEEVETLIAEIVPAVDFHGNGSPSLQQWANTSRKNPFKALPTIQLFDSKGQLIEHHGPPGIPRLFQKEGEQHVDKFSFFVLPTPLQVGYLQVELSLRHRDQTTWQFAETLASIAPFLVLALGIAGYFFSSKAAEPLENTLLVLRRFMNDAGHELSTPISIIQANAEAMELDITGNEPAENRLAIINRASVRMGGLVQDLMLLSKMESPQLETRKAVIELDKIAKHLLEEFDELFKAKDIKLIYDKLEPTQIYGDAESLKRLIMNLLQNALRYTDSGGSVTVSLETASRNARLKIQDTGIGIPGDSLPKIFDRFYRVDKSRSRAAGGVGLGLSIVRAIAEAHKGKIEVDSVVGVGTTFVITIPLKH